MVKHYPMFLDLNDGLVATRVVMVAKRGDVTIQFTVEDLVSLLVRADMFLHKSDPHGEEEFDRVFGLKESKTVEDADIKIKTP